MSDTPHQCFTVSTTAYMRNLNRDELRERCVAIHYQDAPKQTERGTAISMRFPLLILAYYVEETDSEAEKIARILNAHYDATDSLKASAAVLREAGLFTDADYHRTINRIQARVRLRENTACAA